MQVKEARVLSGTLAELGAKSESSDELWRKALRGELKGPNLFWAPAFHPCHRNLVVSFRNAELYLRIGSMAPVAQPEFIDCILKMFIEHGASVMHLQVPWTPGGKLRVLEISISRNTDGTVRAIQFNLQGTEAVHG